MSYLINTIRGSFIRRSFVCFPARNYLSHAFACEDVWERRLNGKILLKVNSESMFHELENAYNRTQKISAVDVDVFVNAQTNDALLTEVEEFVYKLRLTEETGITLPTTHHAVIRLFLKCKRHEDLIRILNDRLNYGIFPDYYCSLLLLDYFLKAGDFRNAAKVGVLDMFQEDYSHVLVTYMSLIAIHKYLLTDQVWDDPLPTPVENEDDDEEIKVRVSFLRNPYFDNHFDLTNGDHICGKSLVMISSKLEDPMRLSYKLMGLALFNSWAKLEQELTNFVSANESQSPGSVYKDAVEFTRKYVENHADSDKLEKVKELLGKVESKHYLSGSLPAAVESKLNENVMKYEKDEIRKQEELYVEWEKLREDRLASFVADMNQRKRLKDIERKKEELKQREELLYFFDREEEIENVIEKKLNILKKRNYKQADDRKEEDYVPPEVHKRRDDGPV